MYMKLSNYTQTDKKITMDKVKCIEEDTQIFHTSIHLRLRQTARVCCTTGTKVVNIYVSL
jgi:hypothetical protein